MATTCGLANGQASLVFNGGTGPITYTWDLDPPLTGPVITDLPAGDYTVTATDATGCQASTTFSILPEGGPVVNVASAQDPVCEPDNGSITLTVTEGVPPYQVAWSHDANLTDLTATGLTAGTYTITVTDANGCVVSIDQTLNFTPQLSLTELEVTPSLCDDNNGSAAFAVTGGQGTLTFTWSHAPTLNAASATGLPPGDYSLTVTDEAGCSAEASVNIPSLSGPSIPVMTPVVATTCGLDNGSISVSPEGGTPPYSYQWGHDLSLDTGDLTDLSAGTYDVTVTDANNCTTSSSFTVAPSVSIQLTAGSLSDANCGQSDGSAEVIVDNATGSLTFTWSHDATLNAPVATGLAADDYAVTVTDESGCTATITLSLADQPGPDLTIATALDAVCTDGTGLIEVTATGGTGPYTYSWSHDPGLTTGLAENLTADTYSVTVTDANNCSATVEQVLSLLPPPTLTPVEVTPSLCTEDNGSATFAANGGQGFLTFTWSHDPMLDAATATGLAAGDYSLTVTDENGCTATADVTIPSVAGPSIPATTAVVATTCGQDNGSISVSPEGGTPPYTYQWGHDLSLDTGDLTDLSAGTYDLTVTDANDCTISSSFTVGASAPLQLSVLNQTDESCGQGNGAIELQVDNATGDLSYIWNHDAGLNAALATNLSAGDYQVTVTDALGCTATISLVVDDLPAPVLALTNAVDALCEDGTGLIELGTTAGTEPFTYTWSHDADLDAPQATDLNAGTYSVTVTDANGCTDIVSVTLELFEGPSTLAIDQVVGTSCGDANGSLSLTTTGGAAPYTYTWSHDDTLSGSVANDLLGGDYEVTVMDANGCSRTETFTVPGSIGLELTITEQMEASCDQADGSVTITVANAVGDLTYDWSHDNSLDTATVDNLLAGSYTVMVTDEAGCSQELTVVIDNLPGPEVSGTATNSLCTDDQGTIELMASGGTGTLTYSWLHDPDLELSTATNLPAGIYTVTVTDERGCTAVFSEEIVFIAGPQLNLSTVNPTICDDGNGSASLNASGGTGPYTFTWSHDAGLDAATAENLTAGDYTVILTDANGCTAEQSFTIEPLLGPTTLDPISQINTSCGEDNGSLSILPVGGVAPYTYAWGHNAELTGGFAFGLPAGDYSLTVTDANGCTISASFNIADSQLPELSLVGVTEPNCNLADGAINLQTDNASGLVTYTWSHDAGLNSATATGLTAGTYQITATDEDGCTDELTVSVSNLNSPNLTGSTITPSLCTDGLGSISLTMEGGMPPYAYAWSHAPGLNSPTADFLNSGDYTISVTDANGCVRIVSENVPLVTGPDIAFNTSPITCVQPNSGGLSLSLSGGLAPFTYAWSTGSDQAEISGLEAGTYQVTVTDANNCVSTAMVTLEDPAPFLLTLSATDPSCTGVIDGQLSVTAEGGSGNFTYAWNNGATTNSLSDLPPGDYVLTVTDTESSCIETIDVTLVDPDPLTISFASEPTCDDASSGSAEAFPDGGSGPYSFVWSNGDNTGTITDLTEGDYTLTVVDNNGCETVGSVSIGSNPLPTLDLVTLVDATCIESNGEVVYATNAIADELTFSWDGPDPQVTIAENPEGGAFITVTSISAGTYQLSVTNENGCTVPGTLEVDALTPWEVTIADQQNVSCAGQADGSATVSVDLPGDYTYQWDAAAGGQITPAVTNLAAGDYSLTISDAEGCTEIVTVSITQPDPLVATINSQADPGCANETSGSVSIGVSGGTGNYTYTWSDDALPASGEQSALGAGDYTLTVTDEQGCTALVSFSLTAPPAIEVDLADATSPTCAGDSDGQLTITATNGVAPYTYLWSDPAAQTSAQASGLTGGTYSVTVTDANNCSQVFSTELADAPAISLEATTVMPPDCADVDNGSITVVASGVVGDFTYNWSNGATGPQVSDLAGGAYLVTATSAAGCTADLTVTLPAGTTLDLNLPQDTTICADEIMVLDLGEYPIRTVIGPNGLNSSEPITLIEDPGTYAIAVEAANGCTGTTSVTVDVTSTPFVAGMVLPSDVVVGDSVVVLETSWPVPDQVTWVYDGTRARLVKEVQNQYWFIFDEVGDYNLGLIGTRAGCEDIISKQITVHADSTTIPSPNLGQLEIESIVISPNPNLGQFEVDVILSNTAELFVSLYDINGILQDRRQGSGQATYNFPYDLNVQPGTYLLLVQTAFDRRTLVVVIN
jgi:hypothetical protein